MLLCDLGISPERPSHHQNLKLQPMYLVSLYVLRSQETQIHSSAISLCSYVTRHKIHVNGDAEILSKYNL